MRLEVISSLYNQFSLWNFYNQCLTENVSFRKAFGIIKLIRRAIFISCTQYVRT